MGGKGPIICGEGLIICREGLNVFPNNINTESVAGRSVGLGSRVGKWFKKIYMGTKVSNIW